MTIFTKLEKLRKIIKNSLEDNIDDVEFKRIIQKLANRWHYKKDRRKGDKLTDLEFKFYEILLSNCYNPSTVYRWLLLEETPPEIRTQIKEFNISLRKASKYKMEYRNLLNTTEQELLEEIKDSVRKYIER
ncbi:hypothetical protein HON88_04075 [Candidatus Woesearchaeota archaeon]|nr:hypothetical protein [Candidatus Woesearchaeota archaeon]